MGQVGPRPLPAPRPLLARAAGEGPPPAMAERDPMLQLATLLLPEEDLAASNNDWAALGGVHWPMDDDVDFQRWPWDCRPFVAPCNTAIPAFRTSVYLT